MEKNDSNVIPDSSNMCDIDNKVDQNAKACDDERETNRTLGESNSTRDSCLIALRNKQIELEKYKTLNDRTLDYDTLECKLKDTLGLLAQKENDIKEGLKLKAYEISVVKEKHDALVKQSLLTKSSYEGLVKEKNKVIMDLKLKEEKYLDKLISMEKKLKFLNEIVYKRNQSIQTIHMLAPKGSTFNGRPTFANPMYLKNALFENPCLYGIPDDTSDLANIFTPDREESLTLEKESRPNLNNDLVKPYYYTKQNNLEYVQSLEKEIDELESDKDDFSNIYDLLLQECVLKDIMCSYLHSLSYLYAHIELQCLYLHKVKECECLAEKLSKQTENVGKQEYNELLKSFSKLEQHSISLELALQQCQEQMKNDTIFKQNGSTVFLKEHEQYHEIQDLKAQLQNKNIAISELKKLIENMKVTMEILPEPSSNKLCDRYKRRCCNLTPAESDSLSHAHTQATQTYYKHQDSRIKKAQELNTKTSVNSNIQDLPKDIKIIKTKIVKGDC
ncbi:hypothetical protein Tco_0613324 [Tanacetum coccineum]